MRTTRGNFLGDSLVDGDSSTYGYRIPANRAELERWDAYKKSNFTASYFCLRKDAECSTIDYLDLELAPRGNYQMEAAFPTRVISGHIISKGLALASRLRRGSAMGAIAPLATAARPCITTRTAAPGLAALRNYSLKLIART